MARKKVGMKRLRETIQACYGNVTQICQQLNISRQTFYNYVEDDESVAVLWKESRDHIVETAESQLMRHVVDVNDGLGDLSAIKFVLETWGKSKGWTKRMELTGADGRGLFDVDLDDDVRAYLQRMGMDEAEVLSYAAGQFNEMIREMMNDPDVVREELDDENGV
jgi:hypothetical protein